MCREIRRRWSFSPIRVFFWKMSRFIRHALFVFIFFLHLFFIWWAFRSARWHRFRSRRHRIKRIESSFSLTFHRLCFWLLTAHWMDFNEFRWISVLNVVVALSRQRMQFSFYVDPFDRKKSVQPYLLSSLSAGWGHRRWLAVRMRFARFQFGFPLVFLHICPPLSRARREEISPETD